ncbi:hypothetical protein C8R45DRAFT_1105446 [Mycena sanguinolenta]|nr:hypothetical protein C8R45DRAFT_1105446 [Mycena sanguinolenta]
MLALRIGPETFAIISADGNFTGGGGISVAELAFYNQHGVRKAFLELNFYAWSVTGDTVTKYLDRAAAAIASFNKFLPTTVAFACLNDVNDPSAGLIDDMESFWCVANFRSSFTAADMANPNLYLTFDDLNHISLDTHVWNIECHPLVVPPALSSYQASGSLSPPQPFTTPTSIAPRPLVSPEESAVSCAGTVGKDCVFYVVSCRFAKA